MEEIPREFRAPTKELGPFEAVYNPRDENLRVDNLEQMDATNRAPFPASTKKPCRIRPLKLICLLPRVFEFSTSRRVEELEQKASDQDASGYLEGERGDVRT